MKKLLVTIISLAALSLASADPSITLQQQRQVDTIDSLNLFIAKDGGLECEGQRVSLQWLDRWIKNTRKHEPPAVTLVLCPKLPSNSDLPKIKSILDFLIGKGVLHTILLQPKDWVP